MGECHADSPDEEVTPEFGRREKKNVLAGKKKKKKNVLAGKVEELHRSRGHTEFGVHLGRLF